MNGRRITGWRGLGRLAGVLLLCASAVAEPTAAATAAFDSYVRGVEARLLRQRGGASSFVAGMTDAERATVRNGGPVVREMTMTGASSLPGAMLHHWSGVAFVRGATAGAFERLLHGFDAYPARFAPEVLTTTVLGQRDGATEVRMRVRQKHVITVVMDTTYDVTFGQGHSWSRSTRIEEIDGAGTKAERALPPGEEHGFLWRQNTYWSYAEEDGGLYLRIESVSLSRAIPTGLGWAVRPFVESVPRESLEFTLQAVIKGLVR